ncbi:hypothetical protein PH242_02790 [Photorhabdus bodei]|uniref:hypothetical protein n=1 Tax=Photorhabdus bodei TaxID=2029681 RepID=UPI00232EE6BC|nr:hypothetical protein [Photorhabdus bodei]MDB6366635.1 hypothetical protein [Photorhabdus bodei]
MYRKNPVLQKKRAYSWFLDDNVNGAVVLRYADVGFFVSKGTDSAKKTIDITRLDKNLGVSNEGPLREERRVGVLSTA